MSDHLAPFRVRDCLVDPSLNRVTCPNRTVQLEPKIMHVLVMLAEHAGEVVTRDALMARVWVGVFVTDDVLHRAIRELRRLFDDDAERPAVIETIRKRGYRLIATVESLPGSVAPEHGRRGAATPARNSAALWVVAAMLVVAVFAGGTVVWIGLRYGAGIGTEARVRFTPLTSDPGNEVDPALSAAGRLAYVARGPDGRSHVFVKGSPQSPSVQVTFGDGREHAPTWSPDERRLAFVRETDGQCSIWLADADGGNARHLRPCASTDELRMSWSPDGSLLAMTAGRSSLESPSHIEVVEITSGASRRVTVPPAAHLGDSQPAFSPDGRRLAFVRSLSGAIADIFTTQIDDPEHAAERVTFDNADMLGVDWDPDGGHLVFSSDRGGSISLWRVALHGGAPMLLAGGGAKLKHPAVARRAGTIAYEDWHYEINLRDLPLFDRDQAAPLSPTSDRWNFHPQVSPDGRQIVFQSTRAGEYELWIAGRDGARPRQLTHTGGTYKSLARWSPDGRALVLVSRREELSDLVVVDATSGQAQTILSEPSLIVAPSWSHDGSRIYFGSPRTGSWQLFTVDRDSGRFEQITTEGGYAALESSDGESLYYVKLDPPGLHRRFRGGDVIVAPVAANDWPNWGLFGGGIFFITRPDAADPMLMLADADGARARPSVRLPDFAWPGIAVARDGRRVIYAHADRREANIGSVAVTWLRAPGRSD